ncbi:MAG: hypothetical protein NTW19_14790 [Planctomycetota bacterium]|nr:hypothetical protein [Planctomycetota bacterium]
MLTFPPPPEGLNDEIAPPRCLGCKYPLVGIDHPSCPECGRVFVPENPTTYSRKPPFIFLQYWLPGLLAAVTVGVLMTSWFALTNNIGVAASVAVPVSMGVLVGYGVTGRMIARLVAVLFAVVATGLALITMHPAGIFCGIILTGIFMVPASFGLLFGAVLRQALKRTRFSQRWHLPILLCLLLPLGVDQIEHRFFDPPEPEVVETHVELPFDPDRAWSAWMFYEEVRRPAPLVLRLGLPRPLGSTGKVTKVGDSRTCNYVHGRLVKQITALEPGKRVAFKVVEQTHVEDHAVQLLRGSFEFAPVGDHHTAATLRTEYVPLLTPRFCWRPIEVACLHTLHRFVLEGMADRVEERSAERRADSQTDDRTEPADERPPEAAHDPRASLSRAGEGQTRP